MAHLIMIGAPASITYTDQKVSTTSGFPTTFNFTGVSFGVADPTRGIVVGVAAVNNTSGGNPTNPPTMTIGGVPATRIAYALRPGGQFAALFVAPVPTGTTGTVSAGLSDGYGTAIGIGVWAIYNVSSFTPVSVATDFKGAGAGSTLTLGLSGSGGCVAAGFVKSISGTWSWSGMSERFDNNSLAGNNLTISGADTSGTLPLSVTATATNVGALNGCSAGFV